MRFALGRAVHFYYVTVLVAITCLFAFGVKHYWDTGLLNVDFVSNQTKGCVMVLTNFMGAATLFAMSSGLASPSFLGTSSPRTREK